MAQVHHLLYLLLKTGDFQLFPELSERKLEGLGFPPSTHPPCGAMRLKEHGHQGHHCEASVRQLGRQFGFPHLWVLRKKAI